MRVILVGSFVLFAAGVHAQPAGVQTAGERYKSVRVLKEIPASQVIEVMSVIAGSLGVTCGHCHAADWESDEKPMKERARQMIALTRQVDASFGGNGTITCNTCHQGRPVPANVAAVEQAGWAKAAPPVVPALPTVSEVFDKYEAALGGSAALGAVVGRVVEGKVTRDNGRTGPASGTFKLEQRTPATARVETAFSYPPEASSEISAEFLRVRRLREFAARARVVGRGTVRGSSTVVVEITNPSGPGYRLHFEDATGLLVARESDKPTPLGRLAERHELSDYRDVDGLREPHRIEWLRADYHVTFEIGAIRHVKP